MSATKVRHKRNKGESKTSIPENGHDCGDSTSKSFLYSELDDSIERRRKRHIRNEAHSLSKKYALSVNTKQQVSSIALKNYFVAGN